jgi:hypothetical protein
MRLDQKEDSGIHSAKAIAKLLGQDEVVALMEDQSSSPDSPEKMRPVVSASTPMMSGDEINSVLRLRRQAHGR